MYKLIGTLMVMAVGTLLLADVSAGDKGKKRSFGSKLSAEESFKKLDTNNDGKLSKEEYLKLAERFSGGDAEKAAKAKEYLSKSFEKAAGGKETLTLEQYKAAREERAKEFRSKKKE